jgi:hypothetical protein
VYGGRESIATTRVPGGREMPKCRQRCRIVGTYALQDFMEDEDNQQEPHAFSDGSIDAQSSPISRLYLAHSWQPGGKRFCPSRYQWHESAWNDPPRRFVIETR